MGINIQTKVKIKFIDLLSPDCVWPYPYTLEQALGVFQWMVKTGEEYNKYNQSGVTELLSMKPTCINFSEIESITSVDDLQKRFHFALLSQDASSSAQEWREDERVKPNAQRSIFFPHNKEGGIHEDHLDSFLKTRGKLKTQLNECHKEAVNIVSIDLRVIPSGFIFRLIYGYEGSSWTFNLSETKSSECFSDTFWRASKKLKSLINKTK